MKRNRARRDRVNLIRVTTRSGDYNEQLDDYTHVLGTEFAHVRTLHGSEIERANQLVGQATHRVDLPACAMTRGLLVTDRLEWGAKLLSINHIDTSRDYLGVISLLCSEGLTPAPERC